MTYRWWEQFPDRYEDELRRLTAAGIRFERDPAAFNMGLLRLHLETEFDGKPLRLCATFPDQYPSFRFEIQVFDWNLPLHQNPLSKHLCLFQYSTWNWRPASDCLADFVTKVVPKVWTMANSAALPPPTEEEPQAEPATVYFSAYESGGVLVDEAWCFDVSKRCGNLQIGSMLDAAPVHRPLAVLEVTSNDGNLLVAPDERVSRLFSKSRIHGRWIYVDEPPFEVVRKASTHDDVTRKLFDYARSNDLGRDVAFMSRNSDVPMYAIIFSDERSQRGAVKGFAWIFLGRPPHKVPSISKPLHKPLKKMNPNSKGRSAL